jgi:S-adenosylmethionine hydrolase
MSVVTFTTDFGVADGYAGAMKGVVLSLAPDAVLGSSGRVEISLRDGSAAELTGVRAGISFELRRVP